MNELLKMSKGNKKLKNTLIFDLPAGRTCPNANECKSFAVMNERVMDNTGDLWTVVDEREPELPNWYEDVYKTINL